MEAQIGKSARWGWVAAALFVLAGCEESHSPSPVLNVTVSVSPDRSTIELGDSLQLAAHVTGATDTTVTWSVVGDGNVGTVTQDGLYRAPLSLPWPPIVAVTASSNAAPRATGTGEVVFPMPDFALEDVNPGSAAYGSLISPLDYRGSVSAWYFGNAG